jgi:hypothetical protein
MGIRLHSVGIASDSITKKKRARRMYTLHDALHSSSGSRERLPVGEDCELEDCEL